MFKMMQSLSKAKKINGQFYFKMNPTKEGFGLK